MRQRGVFLPEGGFWQLTYRRNIQLIVPKLSIFFSAHAATVFSICTAEEISAAVELLVWEWTLPHFKFNIWIINNSRRLDLQMRKSWHLLHSWWRCELECGRENLKNEWKLWELGVKRKLTVVFIKIYECIEQLFETFAWNFKKRTVCKNMKIRAIYGKHMFFVWFPVIEKQLLRHYNNDAERKKEIEKREKEKAEKAKIGGHAIH